MFEKKLGSTSFFALFFTHNTILLDYNEVDRG